MAEDYQKKISVTRLGFYFLLIILAVFLFFNLTKLEKIFILFREIKPLWLILAIIVQILTYVFTANVFHNLLRVYKYESFISRWELFKASLIALFLNQAIPTGGFSGAGYLLYFFQRKKIPSHESFSVAILETITYSFAHFLLLLFSFFYLFFFQGKTIGKLFLGVGALGAFLFIFLNVAFLLLSSKKMLISVSGKIEKHKWLKSLFNKIRLQFPEKELLMDGWESPWTVIKNKSHYLWRPLFWQLIVILADVTTIFLLFNGFNFRPVFLSVLTGLILTKIVAMVSISPGALVFFEGAMILFYASFNIPIQLVVVVTLLFRALSFWLPMPFGLILYRHLSKNKSLNL